MAWPALNPNASRAVAARTSFLGVGNNKGNVFQFHMNWKTMETTIAHLKWKVNHHLCYPLLSFVVPFTGYQFSWKLIWYDMATLSIRSAILFHLPHSLVETQGSRLRDASNQQGKNQPLLWELPPWKETLGRLFVKSHGIQWHNFYATFNSQIHNRDLLRIAP